MSNSYVGYITGARWHRAQKAKMRRNHMELAQRSACNQLKSDQKNSSVRHHAG
jgi:hypothetical protein